ncbi:glycan-binding surface protein [Chitinophaga sp. MM2321]|uniref:glycan-binding surface protein n=1 Tax=Chitinophaga sp. MM2321 TaxID=3137178 RepID=UPI0032D58E91
MKNIYRSLLLLAITMATVVFYTSCKKDNDLPNNGEPRISYIRVTDPVSGDSLLAAAAQGMLIAIVGENLQDAKEIWFNDLMASLTPTYVTSTTILVSVPSKIPTVVDNKLKINFSNGKTLEYFFPVKIGEPIITRMDCEYVPDGGVATISGNYFYEPLTVTFPGGGVAEIVSVEDEMVKVTVPAGALPGQITVKTNFGEVASDFWFRDNRNIFISSDPFSGWWGSGFVVSNPGPEDPATINGNYIRVKDAISGWQWKEVVGGPADAMGAISKNIPDEAILKPENFNLKFELNTKKPFNANVIKLCVGVDNDSHGDYLWNPPYDTKGVWQTVIIPFEEVAAAYNSKLTVSPTGYYARVLFHGGGDLNCDMSFDNFRVVPKVIKK